MIVTTGSFQTPKTKPPAGTEWRCYGMRPVTGRPTDADGRLLIVWEWWAIPKAPKAKAEPEQGQQPPRRKSIVQLEAQRDLFGN